MIQIKTPYEVRMFVITIDPIDAEYVDITVRLLLALVIGAMIGFERTYHGRPAGFRTHVLVCLSTSLLMLLTVYESRWFPAHDAGRVALDPTRMAQGIMTGIGFLGAGTIMREGLTVRGLTTAASIWITAAIGILVGVGFYFPAIVASARTLTTLSMLRWVEDRMPTYFYAQFTVRFQRDDVMPEAEFRKLLTDHGFTVAALNYRLDAAADFFEYRSVIRSQRTSDAARLTHTLKRIDSVRDFSIMPTQD
jgi:putative Mg2+ transporter-C (MgtC) family protein